MQTALWGESDVFTVNDHSIPTEEARTGFYPRLSFLSWDISEVFRRLEQGCLRIRDKERYRLTHVLWPQPNHIPTSCPASFSQRFQWGLLDSVCTAVLYFPLLLLAGLRYELESPSQAPLCIVTISTYHLGARDWSHVRIIYHSTLFCNIFPPTCYLGLPRNLPSSSTKWECLQWEASESLSL